MAPFRVAMIGTGAPDRGRDPSQVTQSGFSVAYRHAPCYRELADTELVACADIDPDHAAAFAEMFEIGPANVYTDHRIMLAEVRPDVVDICTPASTHADLVVDCALDGGVAAIHCEKPMATTWGDCRRMDDVCRRRGVQLTFNHQRRFATPVLTVKRLLDDGTIGALERMEIGASALFSYGTHSIDLCGLFADEAIPEWVIAQIDYRTENIYSGAHNENQAFAQWQYDTGVYGMAAMGMGAGMVDAHHRLIGTEGIIELAPGGGANALVRVNRDDTAGWEAIDGGDGGMGGLSNGYPYMIRSIEEAITALAEDRPSQLSAKHALNASELIFGAYESARRRARVDFPLTIEDNPLEAMVAAGELNPLPPEA